MTDLKEFYSEHVRVLETEVGKLRKRTRVFMVSEIVTFCLAVLAVVVYIVKYPHVTVAFVAAAMFLIYLVVRKCDIRNDRRMELLVKRRLVYDRELSCYMNGDFSVFDSGERYADSCHPYTFDMDVFGRDSLFNRIDRTVTTGGRDALAHSLQTLPTDLEEIERKREAIDEISRNEKWRTEFIVCGMKLPKDSSSAVEKIDTESIVKAVHSVAEVRLPRFFMSKVSLCLAALVLAGFFTTLILSFLTIVPVSIAFNYGILQFFVILCITARPLNKVMKVTGKLFSELKGCVGLIRHIHSVEFDCDELVSMRNNLFNEKADAMKAFDELSGILESLDRRGNVLGLLVFNVLFLNDFFLVRRFLLWKKVYMEHLEHWLDIVSRMDAYVSMSVLRFNHPEATNAEISGDDEVIFRASGLYHPFLGRKAVSNDFNIADGNYYIVTGANMAGKSTFLRAIGVNYILAMNGMPVFAESLHVSMFNLFSSMRTTDDLSNGISYFNAELLRLRRLIDNCRQARRSLIILDEILKGTNSLDKLNGSRLFLEKISALPISGVIATHDLELSKMEQKYPERFHNYCFEIQLAEKIDYTYKITPGVARNQNATYLLNRMLADV